MQLPLIKAHVDVFSDARSRYFGLSFHLHTFIMILNSKGSDESTDMHRLNGAFAARQSDKYQNPVRLCSVRLNTLPINSHEYT